MTLTRESEALLANVTADWDIDQYGEYDRARRELVADLAAIEAAVRAEQAAEVERLRGILRRILPTDSIIDSCDKYELIEVGYAVEGWEARRWRAALAATPVAPAPAAPERCAACGHETRFHAEGQCDCEGDGKAGLCPCPEPRP